MKIIIDSRMREEEKDYLSQYGKLIEIPYQDSVYEEISSHPDVFFCKVNNKLIKAPNVNMVNVETIEGNSPVGKIYPNDVKYNLCQIGKYAVHNFKYTDEKLIKMVDEADLEKVQVHQGYANCSISVIDDNTCITSDKGICDKLMLKDINCLYMEETHIKLIDKNSEETQMQGFIGGATCVIDDKFIIFGDSKLLSNRKELMSFLKKHNKKLVDFKNLQIHDYGGIVLIDD